MPGDNQQACQNTDREIYRERPDDFYADSVHVTENGGLGINCGGMVFVKPLREWHRLATLSESETGTSNPAPHRAVRLKLEIEADTREDLRHAVDHFDRTFDQRVVPGGASGGYSWGWTYTLAEDAGPTHDEYAAALEAWLAKEREASHAGR